MFTLAKFSTIISAILRCDIAFLTCLGQMREIDMILSLSHRPRWPRQVQSGDCCMSLSLTVMPTNAANVNDPLKRKKSTLKTVKLVLLILMRLHQPQYGITYPGHKLTYLLTLVHGQTSADRTDPGPSFQL
jgi:hypothetical protein